MSRRQRRLEAQIAEVLQRTKKLEERVEELETENASLRATVRKLQRGNNKLKRTNRKLGDENRLLRREVRRLGGNVETVVEEAASSEAEEGDGSDEKGDEEPPSGSARSDGGGGGRRERGGQPCHEGKTRPLQPPEKVDRVVVLKPEACSKCGEALSGDDPNPSLHQVLEIPEPTVDVTEYQQHSLVCGCGKRNTAELPPGVPRGHVAFGPRLQAFVALLSGGCRLSKRTIKGLFLDTFGLEISIGSVSNCERAVTLGGETPDPQGLIAATEVAIETARRDGLQQENLDRLRNKAYGSFLRCFNSVEQVACGEADATLQGWDLLRYLEVLESITLDGMHARLQTFFESKRRAVSIVRPLD